MPLKNIMRRNKKYIRQTARKGRERERESEMRMKCKLTGKGRRKSRYLYSQEATVTWRKTKKHIGVLCCGVDDMRLLLLLMEITE